MGKSAPEPPPPPDPFATARAQTGSNVTTAIANTTMANANVKGPLGSTTFNQIGSRKISEPVLDKDGKPVTKRVWQGDPLANPGTSQGRFVTTGYGDGGREEGYWEDTAYNTGDPTKGKWVDETEMVNYDVPIWEQINQLSDNQQKLLGQQESLGMDLNDLASSQVKRIGGVLNTPISGDSLPPGATELLAQYGGSLPRLNLQTSVGMDRLNTGFDATRGPEYVGDLGSAQGGFGATGQGVDYMNPNAVSRAMRDIGGASRGVQYMGDQGLAQTGFGGTGQGVQYSPSLDMGATNYADVGGPSRSVGNFGFESERNRVEDALRQRQMPELDRQRAQLENQLVNQGFTRGTQGFNAQMDEQIRRENDANLAAILAGGQEQTRMGQLALGRFGAENAAQGQADEQARARGLFGLGATAQNNQARLAMQQASNAAQQQEFGQQQARGLFSNEAIGQNNATGLAFNNARNMAQQQEFGQSAERSRLFNEGAAQDNAAAFALNNARNMAQQQDFGQLQARGQFANEALAQNQQARLAETASRNASSAQDFAQTLGRADFGNQARAGNNQLSLAQMQAQNAAMMQQQAADVSRLDTQATARERALQEKLALRNQPINEISALMSGGQVTMPQFTGFRNSAMSETPVGDYVYKSADIEAANYRAQAAADAQANAGLFGMGGQLLGGLFKMSDKRVKTDIKRIGTLPNSLGVYSYRLKGKTGREIGVMAQEVEQLIPWAVVEIDGIKHVNYEAAVV